MLAALPKDLNSVPSIHTRWLTLPVILAMGALTIPSSGLLGYPHTCDVHTCMCMHTQGLRRTYGSKQMVLWVTVQ